MSWICCGRFGRPQGVRGEVRLWPENRETSLLRAGRVLHVGPETGPDEQVTLQSVRADAQGPVVRIAGIEDRDAAAALTGRWWFEDRSSFEPAGKDEYYVADLIGVSVRTVDGRALGPVRDVWNFGGGDILVVEGDRGEILIPFAGDHVVEVDVKAGIVVVRIDVD